MKERIEEIAYGIDAYAAQIADKEHDQAGHDNADHDCYGALLFIEIEH